MSVAAVAVLLSGTALVMGCGDSTGTPDEGVLDQQNLLDGTLAGQSIGRFSDQDGAPDPDGTAYDFQDAQTFVAGVSGRLTRIRVAVRNVSGATLPVILEMREVVGGAPDPDDSQVIGSASVAASVIASSVNEDPATWPSFDLSSLGLDVVAGGTYSFSVRSLSTVGFLFNPEFSMSYEPGAGYRRNRASGPDWVTAGQDFGFQTFVAVP